MLARTLKIAAHALLFVLAVAVFFFGLGVGLQYSPLLGTLLWVAAGGIAALNVLWMFRTGAKAGR